MGVAIPPGLPQGSFSTSCLSLGLSLLPMLCWVQLYDDGVQAYLHCLTYTAKAAIPAMTLAGHPGGLDVLKSTMAQSN